MHTTNVQVIIIVHHSVPQRFRQIFISYSRKEYDKFAEKVMLADRNAEVMHAKERI